jgi:hypothetical protein
MFEQTQNIHEGKATKKIEQVTARAPSATFLALAGIAMAGSLGLFVSGRREAGIFVGLWPLAMLAIGNYNKLVKILGSDRSQVS